MANIFQINEMVIIVDTIRMAIILKPNLLFRLTILTSLKGPADWPCWLLQTFDVVTFI